MYKPVLSILLTPNKFFRKLRPRSLHQSLISFIFYIYFFIFGYFGQLEYSRAAKKCTHAKKCTDEYAEPPPSTGKQDAIYIYETSDRSKQKLPVDVEISFSLTSKMTFGYLMLITIKYGRYNSRRVRTHESDSEVTIGHNNTKDFFCSIRSQHSHKGLEMVWRDSFPRGSFTFTKKLSPQRFLPGLPRFAPTNCPWVSEDASCRVSATIFILFISHMPLVVLQISTGGLIDSESYISAGQVVFVWQIAVLTESCL